MKAIELLKKAIKDNGYQGLNSQHWDCSCRLSDLVNCDANPSHCELLPVEPLFTEPEDSDAD